MKSKKRIHGRAILIFLILEISNISNFDRCKKKMNNNNKNKNDIIINGIIFDYLPWIYLSIFHSVPKSRIFDVNV